MEKSDTGDRPAASGYRLEIATPASRIALAGLIVAVGALAVLPAFASRALVQDLFFVLTMLALAQYWNLLAGSAGLVSVGQQVFVGLGGYGLFAATIVFGIDPLAAVFVAGIGALILAAPTALVIFRLEGAYFAIGTWVIAEVFRLVLAQFKLLGGGTGTSLPTDAVRQMAGIEWVATLLDLRTSAARDVISYWLALVLAVVSIGAIYRFMLSGKGLALSACRDSEPASASIGVEARRLRMTVYMFCAFATGMTGAIIYLQTARISPDAAFSVVDWTAYVIFIVVIGGIGTIEGPIIGVVVLYVLRDYLSDFGTWYLILLGGLAIAVMLISPGGIWGLIARRFNLYLFPTKRRLVQQTAQRSLHPRQ